MTTHKGRVFTDEQLAAITGRVRAKYDDAEGYFTIEAWQRLKDQYWLLNKEYRAVAVDTDTPKNVVAGLYALIGHEMSMSAARILTLDFINQWKKDGTVLTVLNKRNTGYVKELLHHSFLDELTTGLPLLSLYKSLRLLRETVYIDERMYHLMTGELVPLAESNRKRALNVTEYEQLNKILLDVAYEKALHGYELQSILRGYHTLYNFY